MLSGTRAEVEKLHELAVENDRLSKEKATKYWDAAHKAKECELEVGNLVLYKWARPRKSMPLWEPVMYEVVPIEDEPIEDEPLTDAPLA